MVYCGSIHHPVAVTTRNITFLVGNPFKPSFVAGILGILWYVHTQVDILQCRGRACTKVESGKSDCYWVAISSRTYLDVPGS